MTDIMDIIGKMADAEKEAEGMTFVAPCLEHGVVRIRISGIVKTLRPPRDFQGWGRFRYNGGKRARLEGEAMPYERDEYLGRLPSMSFRLAFFVEDGTWLAFPANRGVANAMAGRCEPTLIRLVDGGSRFDAVIASFDGATWWYREPDLRFSPIAAETLNREAEAGTDPDKVRYKGMTPEDRAAYDVALNPVRVDGMPDIPITDEDMLRRSLERGGGKLLSFTDREDRWIVEWETASGQRHSSAVSKTHMTVISAGICLSGMDKDFDLLSLVGVVEGRNRDYYDDDDW
jgi:hypothetical protein